MVFPLPAAQKGELLEKGIVIVEKGEFVSKIVGKKVVIEFVEDRS